MRYKVTTPAGHKWIGFAKTKLSQMEKQRQRLRLPFMKKVLFMGDVYVMIYTAERDSWIYIFGGTAGQILFATPDGGTVDTKVYDYLNDTYGDAVLANGVSDDTLHPAFNGQSHYGHQISINFASAWGTTSLDPNEIPFAVSPPYEIEVVSLNDTLAVRTADGVFDVATLPVGAFVWNYEYARAQKNFVYIPRTHNAMWNLVNGQEWWIFTPATTNFFQSAWWVPNILYAESGNGVLVPGFYYGDLYGIWVGKDDPNPESPGMPSEVVKVTYNGLLDCRKSNPLLPYGYAETLVSLDGEIYNTIYVYLDSTPMPDYGNPSILYQALLYDRDAGTEMHGKSWTFSYQPTFVPTGDYTVSMWNSPDSRPETLFGYDQDYVGMVVSNGTFADVILWTGTTYTLMTTSEYHSHSYSYDGSLLAVFEGGATISRVRVFDLKERTELRDSMIIAPILATSACVIPYRPEQFTPVPLTFDGIASETVDDQAFIKAVAPFGWVAYNKLIPDGFLWKKIICSDGIHARSALFDDPCMTGNVTLITPDTIPPTGTYTIKVDGVSYTGTWGEVIAQLPYVLWSSTGSVPYEVALATWSTSSNGGGVAVPVDATIDRGNADTIPVPELAVLEDIFGLPYVTGALGEATITENLVPPVECEETLHNKYEATTTCGQDAVYQVLVPAPTSGVQFSSPATGTLIGIGSEIVFTGGKTPYSVSASNGVTLSKVNDTTWEVTAIADCLVRADLLSTTVTVEDYCGFTAERQFRQEAANADWMIESRIYPGTWLSLSGDGNFGIRVAGVYEPITEYSCSGFFCQCTGGSGLAYIVGAYYYIENFNCFSSSGCTCDPWPESPLDGVARCPGAGGCGANYNVTGTVVRFKLEWRCNAP